VHDRHRIYDPALTVCLILDTPAPVPFGTVRSRAVRDTLVMFHLITTIGRGAAVLGEAVLIALAVPIAILVIGAPIALVVRVVLAVVGGPWSTS
jgi:hypothetical protein